MVNRTSPHTRSLTSTTYHTSTPSISPSNHITRKRYPHSIQSIPSIRPPPPPLQNRPLLRTTKHIHNLELTLPLLPQLPTTRPHFARLVRGSEIHQVDQPRDGEAHFEIGKWLSDAASGDNEERGEGGGLPCAAGCEREGSVGDNKPGDSG